MTDGQDLGLRHERLRQAANFHRAVGWLALACATLWAAYALGGVLDLIQSTAPQRIGSLVFAGIGLTGWLHTRRAETKIRREATKSDQA